MTDRELLEATQAAEAALRDAYAEARRVVEERRKEVEPLLKAYQEARDAVTLRLGLEAKVSTFWKALSAHEAAWNALQRQIGDRTNPIRNGAGLP